MRVKKHFLYLDTMISLDLFLKQLVIHGYFSQLLLEPGDF